MYAELQQLLLDTSDMAEFLGEVAKLAAVVPGASRGVTLCPRADQTFTVASSDAHAVDVDEVQ